METKPRKKRTDRNHAIYKVVIAGECYVGVTVVDGGIVTSIKRRLNKHWYRRNDPTRWNWRIYEALRAVERNEATVVLLEVIRGKAAAHKRERELIKVIGPTLNSDVR